MERKFLEVEGLRVHAVDLGGSDKPRLLLVHGLGGSIESWREVLEDLSRLFHVTAVDLPGYGQSDKPDASYTMEFFADFTCSLIDRLEAESIVLVGHSMGGMIAMKTYLRCSERIRALVLIDAAGVSGTAAEKIRRYMADGWNMERLRRIYLDCIIGRLGELDEARLKEILSMMEDPRFRRAYLRSLDAISKPLSSEEIKRIRVPTLIVWGSDDKLTPLEDGIRLNELIEGSRLVVVDGAGHSPHAEDPRRVVEEVGKFVSELK